MARKQGVSYFLVEDALDNVGIKEDLDALDKYHGAGGGASAIALSFFACEKSPDEISTAPGDSLLGQVILVNYQALGSPWFTHSYIYEAILRTPAIPDATGGSKNLLNNYISADRDFGVVVKGRQFIVRGIYYCQQNASTNVCAHACLKMALNTASAQSHRTTSESINRALGMSPPISGLSLGQVTTIIDGVPGLTTHVENCAGLTPAQYVSVLSSIVESGQLALLVFTTGIGTNVEHVVTVLGHTRNSDEWHPQAIPAYAGPNSAQYYRSSSWIDHFLIHDDNFGPYYALSSRALEEDKNVRAQHIIAVCPRPMNIRADYAESCTSIVLPQIIQQLPSGIGRWLDYMRASSHVYVLRTLLLSRADYVQHLKMAAPHDGSAATAADLASISGLPERFWMVELSLPPLYTGNLSKLGELLFDADSAPDPTNLTALLLAARLPGILILRGATGAFDAKSAGLLAHSPVYRQRSHSHEW